MSCNVPSSTHGPFLLLQYLQEVTQGYIGFGLWKTIFSPCRKLEDCSSDLLQICSWNLCLKIRLVIFSWIVFFQLLGFYVCLIFVMSFLYIITATITLFCICFMICSANFMIASLWTIYVYLNKVCRMYCLNSDNQGVVCLTFCCFLSFFKKVVKITETSNWKECLIYFRN